MCKSLRHPFLDLFLTQFRIAGTQERGQSVSCQLPGLMGKPEPFHSSFRPEHSGDIQVYDLDSPQVACRRSGRGPHG
jgi:hypothetical protein